MDRETANIHPSAEVAPDALIGAGTQIWHYAQVREGARIGRHCILGKGVYIDHGVTIGDNCKLQNGASIYHPAILKDGIFVGPGAIVANDKYPRAVNPDMTLKGKSDWQPEAVIIEKGATIGAGAMLLPGVTISRWALVGAGAVVTADVPPHALVLGNPARQAGYVCRLGHTLKKSNDIFVCPRCGEAYLSGFLLR